MKIRPPYHYPADRQDALKKAVRLEWITVALLLITTVVMYLTMGSSQAMKTAWIEDMLSLIPPLSFLIAMHFRDRPPSRMFPYGHRRAMLLSFLVAAVSILVVGLYILYDSGRTLIEQIHPTVGYFSLFGSNWQIWSGWVMIAALLYSMVPPVILGRMKLSLARELHEKTLHADATMNKADWLTAAAAILGILGIGMGIWWADAVAAIAISLDVVKDGVTNIKRAMGDLMDRRPSDVTSAKPLPLPEELREYLRSLPDVVDAGVRLREEGHAISGEIFLVLNGQPVLAGRLEEISGQAARLDWRLYDLVVMPVTKL